MILYRYIIYELSKIKLKRHIKLLHYRKSDICYYQQNVIPLQHQKPQIIKVCMKINGDEVTLKQLIFLCLYYGFARHLPSRRFGGKALRAWCCKHIFKHCGQNVNIKRGAKFGTGVGLSLGDNSDLGENCSVPSNLTIGHDVMMAPYCTILDRNHRYDNKDIPIRLQGNAERKPTIIEDNVWIGYQVLILPGRTIRNGSIIAGGCVLCKDFPSNSIIGGNPSKFIRSRV